MPLNTSDYFLFTLFITAFSELLFSSMYIDILSHHTSASYPTLTFFVPVVFLVASIV